MRTQASTAPTGASANVGHHFSSLAIRIKAALPPTTAAGGNGLAHQFLDLPIRSRHNPSNPKECAEEMNDTESSTSKDTELTPGTTEYTPAASEYAPSSVLSFIQDGLGQGWSRNQTLRNSVKDDAQKDADYWRDGICALMERDTELSFDDANNLLQHRFLCVYGTMALIEQYYADARAAGYGADDPPLSSDALNALQAQRPGATHRTEELLSKLPDHHDRVKNFKLTMSGLNELRTRMASSTLPDWTISALQTII